VVELPDNYAVLVQYGHKQRLRRTEWVAGAVCFICGFVLLLPGGIFANSDAYSFIRATVSEEWVGAIMLLAGGLRLVGLVINGARRRVTPWMRLAGALIGAGIFTALALGFAASGVLGLWLGTWPVYAVVEYFNIYDTTRDARQAHG
jgi:hypothetical protein